MPNRALVPIDCGKARQVFSSVVIDHWLSRVPSEPSGGGIDVVIDAGLAENRSVSLLRVEDGPSVLTVTPDRADELGVSASAELDGRRLAIALAAAGITLNDPDHLFYLPLADRSALFAGPPANGTRQLTQDDAEPFAAFVDAAPEDDLDEAFVELDHWLVFGTFDGDRLVAVASMYPWRGTRLADLGVITLPASRGRGLGRQTVRAMSAHALGLGFEPQYRCQVDNAASVALARAAGFAHFGQWEVIDTDD